MEDNAEAVMQTRNNAKEMWHKGVTTQRKCDVGTTWFSRRG